MLKVDYIFIKISFCKVLGFGILAFILLLSEIAPWMDQGKSFRILKFVFGRERKPLDKQGKNKS